MTNNGDLLFLVIFFIVNYACTAFFISKTPDPCTEFGMSLNAFVAAGIAGTATMAAFIIVLIAGVAGYCISIRAARAYWKGSTMSPPCGGGCSHTFSSRGSPRPYLHFCSPSPGPARSCGLARPRHTLL